VRPKSETGRTGLPIGLLYISSYLKQFGYDVVVRDLNCQEIEDDLWGNIAILGISMLSHTRKEPYRLIRKIKEKYPDIKIVVGGIHATTFPKMLVDEFPIDATVIGEGEITFKELCDYWIKGIGDLKEINGIATKKHGIHKPRELIENLDDLPFPDYSQINFDDYYCTMARNRPNEVIDGIKISEAKYCNLITSRGCIGRCKYCNAYIHWGYAVRFRTANNILEEIKYLYKKGIRIFNFNDDSFGQDRNIVIELCKKIVKSKIKFVWYCDMRPDSVDEDMLKWMKKAGCFVISFGIESGSDKILKSIGKGITKEQIRKSMKITKSTGIKAYALLMVGNQGETNDTIAETINLMNELEIDIYSTNGFVWVYPGTEYHRIMEKRRQIRKEYWITERNEIPIFFDSFTQLDLDRWYNMMITRIPKRW